MHIQTIRIGKFRHLLNEEIGPFTMNGESSDIIAFAGPNGSGKSSVLELLSYALSSSYSLGFQLSRTFSDHSFEVAIGLTPEEKLIVIEGINSDLRPVEAEIFNELSVLDGRTDLSESQRESMKLEHGAQKRRPYKFHYSTLEYLSKYSVYYRAYNFDNGEYSKDPTLHNQIHSIVTRELKDRLQRSLGFFLRADRSYPQKGFDQRRLFNFQNTLTKEHLWQVAFNTSELQYQDMYDYLVQLRYHYYRELGAYHSSLKKGLLAGIEPEDPIKPYEMLLQSLFPEYSFADINENIPSNLFVQIPSGETITFNDLSSGEKEVFFILSFFIRHNVTNAIIALDEPELHLHPELSRLLVKNMREIRPGNQIWIATHNAEIIDEAGRDRVIYAVRDATTRMSKFESARDEQEWLAQLRNLFGLSGYIGIAKNLVFLEGDNSSQDRKFFSAMFRASASSYKLVPAASSDNFSRISSAVLAILESNVASMNFFLIRDRDYLTEEMASKYASHSSGRVFVLKKHEIENYLIDFKAISISLRDIFNISLSEHDVRAGMHKIASKMSAQVARDMSSFRLNLIARPQDFSLGNILNNTAVIGEEPASMHTANLLVRAFVERSASIKQHLWLELDESKVCDLVHNSIEEVRSALLSDHWVSLFPGKELLNSFSRSIGINTPVALQNSIIKLMGTTPDRVDPELAQIFQKVHAS